MKKMKQVPFSIELAKQIQNKEVEGRIVTRDGRPARIICFDRVHANYTILSLVSTGNEEFIYIHLSDGRLDKNHMTDLDLFIEVPDNEPQFKPFDKVLVRDNDRDIWVASFFSHYSGKKDFPYITVTASWVQCIPYEGNEHLLGTTDKPKEN